MLQNNLINHISLVVDRSGSMANQPVETVFDKELAYLKQRSVELNQETRISIYLFNNQVDVLAFDMDVMRFNSLKGYFVASGQTALIDAVYKSIEDNEQLPELYGDHAFLQYVITDGQENASKKNSVGLSNVLKNLPANWTTACLVPNANGRFEAKKFGFNDESIAVWDTVSKGGFEKVGKQFTSTMDQYFTMRSSGVRGTKGLFQLDSSQIQKNQLAELDPKFYQVFPVHQEDAIKHYVESWTQQPYRLGSSYYQPTKKVTIQDYKNILLQDVKNGKIYEGSRQLLGLPDSTVEVEPGNHKDWRIFIQSTSVNRKLFPNTFVLVRR